VWERSSNGAEAAAPRVFISYAHEPGSDAHGDLVRQLWLFLRAQGIDAHVDLVAVGRRQDWALWMADQIREADHILVIASPAYRTRAQGQSSPEQGRGVQWEARLIRDAFYRDQSALNRFVPVILPGQTADGVPDFLAPATTTMYYVEQFTVDGAESLLRLLTGQPAEVQPPLGPKPILPPNSSKLPGEPDHVAGAVLNEIGDVSGQAVKCRPHASVLPTPSSHFVDQDDVVRKVLDLLEQRRTAGAPLGIHVFGGMAGVGKTELVVQIGHRIAGAFPDGALFLDLAGYRQGMDPIPPAQALRLLLAQRGVIPDKTQQAEAVLRTLWRGECAGRRMLIILDNARDQEQVTPLLPDVAECLVLVTSRRAFIGLPCSTPRKLEELSPEKAAELLRSVAGLAPDQHDPEVEHVVHWCGRLPLAIVIAGSMLAHRPGYTPAELADDLQRERTFLEDLDEDDSSLHIAVHASLRLSYRFLPDNLMRAFRLCAWHPGPEVTEPAMAVMLIEPTPQDHPVRVSDRTIAEARRRLLALADRNLLRMQSHTHRFCIHDLVRASAQLLPPRYDREHILAHLNRAYWTTLEHVERWRLGGQLPGPGLLLAPSEDTPLVAIPDVNAADAWVLQERENLLAFVDAIDHRAVFVSGILAAQLRDLGMLADAERCYQAAERSCAVIGLDEGRAHALRGLAQVATIRGDHAAARRDYQRARAISRRSRDNMGLALALRGLGNVAYLVDDLKTAENYLLRAISLFAEHELVRQGHPAALREYGMTLACLVNVKHAQGNYWSALELMKQAQQAYGKSGDVRSQHLLATRLAEIRMRFGDYHGARDMLNQLLDDVQLSANAKAEALWQLGQIEKETGDPNKAITLFERVLHLREQREEPLGQASALLGLADAERLAGRLDDARPHFEQARHRSSELNDLSGVADATLGLGDVAQAAGDHAQATRHWQEALLLATEVDAAHVASKGPRTTEPRQQQMSRACTQLAHRQSRRFGERAVRGMSGYCPGSGGPRQLAWDEPDGFVRCDPPGRPAGGLVESGAGAAVSGCIDERRVSRWRRRCRRRGSLGCWWRRRSIRLSLPFSPRKTRPVGAMHPAFGGTNVAYWWANSDLPSSTPSWHRLLGVLIFSTVESPNKRANWTWKGAHYDLAVGRPGHTAGHDRQGCRR
jgi:tetratricopeptide (TPR) repeat protein